MHAHTSMNLYCRSGFVSDNFNNAIIPILTLPVDRDSAQWKLDDKFVQRRRNLWWEIIVFEMIHVCIYSVSRLAYDLRIVIFIVHGTGATHFNFPSPQRL